MGKSMYDFGKQVKDKARQQKQEDTKQYSLQQFKITAF
jgi:hypothetical protein